MHEITLKSMPVVVSTSVETRHLADCACGWGTPLAESREELYPVIIGHYRKVGIISEHA